MLAGATGLEPATSAVTGQRSNQLSYAPVKGGGNVENPPACVNSGFKTCRVVFKSGLLRAIKSGQVCAIKSGLVV